MKSEKLKVNKEKTMNKPVILFSLLFFLSSFAAAQAFDDLAYPNPDRPTYFQQEMSSLMKFQAANDINVPFFASLSGRLNLAIYNKDYLRPLSGIDTLNQIYGIPDSLLTDWFNHDYPGGSDSIGDIQFLLGGQIRINSYFYIPILFNVGHWNVSKIMGAGEIKTSNRIDYVSTNGTHSSRSIEYREPLKASESNTSLFGGSGLFINTEKIKGGVYMGAAYSSKEEKLGFQIALVPLVKTSEWAVVGWVLDSLLGYFGLGDAVMLGEEKGNAKISGLANTLNIGLDLAFKRMHWGPFSLDAQAVYNRGNYDAAAKADTYGGKLTGTFTFPLGFTFEGGWKHFFALSQIYADDYPDTVYFSASVFFPFKHITFGVLYQYDNITKSQFGVALTTNFLSGFAFLGLPKTDKNKYALELAGSFGGRFRVDGWKANKD